MSYGKSFRHKTDSKDTLRLIMNKDEMRLLIIALDQYRKDRSLKLALPQALESERIDWELERSFINTLLFRLKEGEERLLTEEEIENRNNEIKKAEMFVKDEIYSNINKADEDEKEQIYQIAGMQGLQRNMETNTGF